MPHRILVLGAGYAGASAAGYLARQLHPGDVQVTVVNAAPDFVERIRLHQLAAGQELRHYGLAEMFRGTGIRLRIARVTALDAGQRTVTVTDGEGSDQLEYDTLLYTLGSTAAEHGVAGVGEYAFHVAQRPAALRLRQRLQELGDNDRVLVVGGNLTAIEAATEIAESRPELCVTVATTGELGGWLGSTARRHLWRAVDRFGITVHEHTTIERVEESGAIAVDGSAFTSEAIVWAAGCAVSPIATASGLAAADDGRIIVDRRMRSVSHPEVYAAGDSGYAIGNNGQPLPMSCFSAQLMRMQATAAIVAELTGRTSSTLPLGYLGNCVSLGRRDAIFQWVGSNARSTSWALRGRVAARVKAAILSGVAWNMGHPTYGLPTRTQRVISAPSRGTATVAD